MPRPVTLFTGQWADLPLVELLPKVKEMGYDGVELACWGDHFDVQAALNDDSYIANHWELLKKNDLACDAISSPEDKRAVHPGTHEDQVGRLDRSKVGLANLGQPGDRPPLL